MADAKMLEYPRDAELKLVYDVRPADGVPLKSADGKYAGLITTVLGANGMPFGKVEYKLPPSRVAFPVRDTFQGGKSATQDLSVEVPATLLEALKSAEAPAKAAFLELEPTLDLQYAGMVRGPMIAGAFPEHLILRVSGWAEKARTGKVPAKPEELGWRDTRFYRVMSEGAAGLPVLSPYAAGGDRLVGPDDILKGSVVSGVFGPPRYSITPAGKVNVSLTAYEVYIHPPRLRQPGEGGREEDDEGRGKAKKPRGPRGGVLEAAG